MSHFFESRARANASFKIGIEREEAWSTITDMFRDRSGSLVPGSYTLTPDSSNNVPESGSIYTFRTANGTEGKVAITEWNPPYSFAYEEQMRGPNEKRPAQSYMTLEIKDISTGLGLEVFRTQTPSSGNLLWTTICLIRKISGSGGAAGMLDSMLGPSSRHASAWAGGWKRIPIDEGTVVKI